MLSAELTSKRAGNFCASQNHRLMAGWDTEPTSRDYQEFEELHRAMQGMKIKPLLRHLKSIVSCDLSGELINKTWKIIQEEKLPLGLITYAQEKAVEQLFDHDPSLNFSTPHTRNGVERESECIAILSEKTGIDFANTGDDQMHLCVDGVGCTPDAIAFNDLSLIGTGAEAKCKSPLEHTKNMLIRNNQDLLTNAFDHFTQIQTTMLVTDTDHWHFANYNPYANTDALRFGYIIVTRDDKFIHALSKRIEAAKKIKDDFLKEIEANLKIEGGACWAA